MESSQGETGTMMHNFYVNPALLPYVEDAGPLHLGDNPSGHAPIMMVLRVNDIPKPKVEEDVRAPKRLAWGRASAEELKRYSASLQEKLEGIVEPECLQCSDTKCSSKDHSVQRDQYVVDVMSSWIEASYSTVPLVRSKPEEKGGGGSLRLPGWKENCEPLAKDAKFWCTLCLGVCWSTLQW